MRLVMSMAVPAALAVIFIALTPAMTQGGEDTDRANFAGRLALAIENRLTEELSGPGRAVNSVKAVIPDRLREPEDYDAVEISVPDQNRRGDRIFVAVSFLKGARAVHRINVMAEADVAMASVVAARDIERGAVIREGDITIETIRAGAGYTENITDPSRVIGKTADTSFKAGSPIPANRLSKSKLVRMGDMVTIVASSGPMRITAMGRAGQDGDRDDWIRVTNIDSNKTINARVTGPGEVAVEF